jgi:pimeloyl-ACP methyl ester carboxylesterase
MTENLPGEREAASDPLFLVHGDFGDGYDAWNQVSEQIGAQRQTIVVDRLGFGDRVAPDARFTIADDARYLLDVVRDMRLEGIHLAGHSYGGLVALEMAAQQPALIRSLHLIEPPLFDLVPDNPAVKEMDRLARSLQEQYAELGDDAMTAAFFAMIGAERTVERLRGTAEWQRLCTYAARFARAQPVGTYSRSVLERLPDTLPIGLYTGGRSHAALRAVVAALAARLPGARVTDVPDAGHAVQMAGDDFVTPLLALAREADAGWQREALPGSDDAGE